MQTQLPSTWRETTLGEVTIYINRGITPKYSETDGNVVLNQKCIRNWDISLTNSRLIRRDQRVPSEKYIKKSDILICSTGVGTLGRVAQVKNADEQITVDSHITIVRPNPDQVSPVFLGYVLKKSEKAIEQMAEGSTGQTELARAKLTQLIIKLPATVESQNDIAEVVLSLDNKIELLRQENKTLESIAKTLFNEWFANSMSGEDMLLSEVIDVNPKESLKKGKSVKFFDMKTLSEMESSIRQPIRRAFTSGSKFRNGDTLMARITPCLENGKTGYMSQLDLDETAFGSTEFIVLRAKKHVSPYFVYCLARSTRFRDFAIRSMSGTSGRQRVQAERLENYQLNINNKLNEFNNVSDSLFVKVRENQLQIQTLSILRDTLLPILMKGEIRIKE